MSKSGFPSPLCPPKINSKADRLPPQRIEALSVIDLAKRKGLIPLRQSAID